MANRLCAAVMCCAYVRKFHCAVVGSCYMSGRTCIEHGYVAKSAFFKGVSHFWQMFHREGEVAQHHYWCQKTRVIALSCGIKIMKICTVHHLALSQYTHLTDGRTELRQQYRVLHYMQPHGKNWSTETASTLSTMLTSV